MLNAELGRLISRCRQKKDQKVVEEWATELFERLRETPARDSLFAQDYNWYNMVGVIEYISQSPLAQRENGRSKVRSSLSQFSPRSDLCLTNSATNTDGRDSWQEARDHSRLARQQRYPGDAVAS